MAQQVPHIYQQNFSKDYQQVHPLFFIAIGIGIGFAIGVLVTNAQQNPLAEFFDGLTPENVAPELLGLVLTYGIIEIVLRNNQKRQSETALKERLIRQMGSTVNSDAIHAIEELRAHGWLMDGSMNKANLQLANLMGADLTMANLMKSSLMGANLERVKLMGAKLEFVKLTFANLIGANLEWADLEWTNFWYADLERANLMNANLKQADMVGANLVGVKLKNAKLMGAEFDNNTILPDGENWTPDTDMTRFTDPDHPHFWEPPSN